MIIVVGAGGKTGSFLLEHYLASATDEVVGVTKSRPLSSETLCDSGANEILIIYPAVSSCRPYDEDALEQDNAAFSRFFEQLKCARRRIKIVFFSTIALYETCEKNFCDRNFIPATFQNPYVEHKCFVENLLASESSMDIRASVLRMGALLSSPLTDETFLAAAWNRVSRGAASGLVDPSNLFNACLPRVVLPRLISATSAILDYQYFWRSNICCVEPVTISKIERLLRDRFDVEHESVSAGLPTSKERVIIADRRIENVLPKSTETVLRDYFNFNSEASK